MKYAVLLTLLGVAQSALAAQYRGIAWLLVWSGVSFIVVGAAYAGAGPGVFGKRPDGTMRAANVLLLLPYLLFTRTVWFLQTRLSREPARSEVLPGLWLGRRVGAAELPPDTRLVVDLTAEFPEPRAVRTGCSYLCLPVLDYTAPDERALQEVVLRVTACDEGVVYIHCALGHGRSALVTAAVLLGRGATGDAAEAERLVKAARPGVELSVVQRALLGRLAVADQEALSAEKV